MRTALLVTQAKPKPLGTFQLKLDSSSPVSFWVDGIPTSFTCKESKSAGNKYTKLEVLELKGSVDAHLFHLLRQPRTYGPISGSVNDFRRNEPCRIIDSVFQIHPNSPSSPTTYLFIQAHSAQTLLLFIIANCQNKCNKPVRAGS